MNAPGPHRDLVVIGASAGGVEALRTLVSALPRDLAAGILIVLHLRAGSPSALTSVLAAVSPLPVHSAEDGAPIENGHLYVAPPDHHLLVDGDHLVLSDGPAENGHRPSIDVLFRSAAARGPATVGIVLSGVLDDGTAGLVAIKSRGGLAIVQDPADAAYRGMPDSAVANVDVDELLTAGVIGARLGQILGAPAGRDWSADSLLDPADEQLQAALWTALRSLDDKAELAERMATSARLRGNTALARRYASSMQEARFAARLLRGRLTAGESDRIKDGGAENGSG
jgi:two-component system chemotaxis response regulator CheB